MWGIWIEVNQIIQWWPISLLKYYTVNTHSVIHLPLQSQSIEFQCFWNLGLLCKLFLYGLFPSSNYIKLRKIFFFYLSLLVLINLKSLTLSIFLGLEGKHLLVQHAKHCWLILWKQLFWGRLIAHVFRCRIMTLKQKTRNKPNDSWFLSL